MLFHVKYVEMERLQNQMDWTKFRLQKKLNY